MDDREGTHRQLPISQPLQIAWDVVVPPGICVSWCLLRTTPAHQSSSGPDLEYLKAVNSVAPPKASFPCNTSKEVIQMTNQERLRDSSGCSANRAQISVFLKGGCRNSGNRGMTKTHNQITATPTQGKLNRSRRFLPRSLTSQLTRRHRPFFSVDPTHGVTD